jgi:hypothetical protein
MFLAWSSVPERSQMREKIDMDSYLLENPACFCLDAGEP